MAHSIGPKAAVGGDGQVESHCGKRWSGLQALE